MRLYISRNIPLYLIDIMSEYQVLGCKFSHRILIFMDEVLYLLLRGPNAFLTSDALYLVFLFIYAFQFPFSYKEFEDLL